MQAVLFMLVSEGVCDGESFRGRVLQRHRTKFLTNFRTPWKKKQSRSVFPSSISSPRKLSGKCWKNTNSISWNSDILACLSFLSILNEHNIITCHLLDAFIQNDLHTFSTVDNPHRSNLGWSVLPRDRTTCRLQWDSNLLPPDSKSSTLPTEPQPPWRTVL